jgi:hypothetical protein
VEVAQSVYFAGGLRATEFVSGIIIIINAHYDIILAEFLFNVTWIVLQVKTYSVRQCFMS